MVHQTNPGPEASEISGNCARYDHVYIFNAHLLSIDLNCRTKETICLKTSMEYMLSNMEANTSADENETS